MIYGELGRYPLEIDIKSRIISFWARIIFGKELKLSKIIYNLSYHMSITNGEHFPWLDHAKKILSECAPHIFGTHKLLFTQTGFALQLLETYKFSLNNIGILY